MERLVIRVGSNPAVPCKFDLDFAVDLDKKTWNGLKEIFDALADVYHILGDNYNLDRLREIVQADRDGRCFIAKAKVGEYIFVPNDDGEIVECRVQGVSLPVHGKNLILHLGGYPAVNLWADRENFDWWKTREAAEAAMKVRRGDEG